MGKIDISPYEVRKAAGQLRECANSLNDKLRTFKDIEDSIEAAWKSKYTSQYLYCLETTESSLRKTNQSIYSAAEKLERIAGKAEKAEREIKESLENVGRKNAGRGG